MTKGGISLQTSQIGEYPAVICPRPRCEKFASWVRQAGNRANSLQWAAIIVKMLNNTTTTKHPPGLRNPFLISRPPSDSYLIFLLKRRLVFVHQRKGLRASVTPSSFLTCFLALVTPRRVFAEGRR